METKNPNRLIALEYHWPHWLKELWNRYNHVCLLAKRAKEIRTVEGLRETLAELDTLAEEEARLFDVFAKAKAHYDRELSYRTNGCNNSQSPITAPPYVVEVLSESEGTRFPEPLRKEFLQEN